MIKLLNNLSQRDYILMVVSLILILGQVFLDLQLPEYMSEITLLVQTPGDNLNEILSIGSLMLGAALGSLILAVIVAVLVSRVSTRFAANLRGKMFNKVLSLSMEDIGGFSTSSLITRSTNDITQIQMFLIMGMQMLFRAPIMAVWAALRISNSHPAWTTATIIAGILLFAIIGGSMSLAIPKFKQRQKFTDDLNRVTRENLTGINVVRAYNAEAYQVNKFEETNDNLRNTNLFANRVMTIMQPSMVVILNGLTLAIYWIGAILIQNAQMANRLLLFSDMIVFSTYAMQVIMSLLMLVVVFTMYPAAQVSAGRISEVLNTESTIRDGKETSGKNDKVGEITFNIVNFRYPRAEKNMLSDISFEVKQGETVAIIGSTGSGKSTLINLIPRFYDATTGEILLNGVNVKDYALDVLNQKVGFVTQEAILFSGDIRSNISYGDNGQEELTENEMKRAAEIAQASDFIEKLDECYAAKVSQDGSNFSGGQKQRLSIALAIARQPEILIFDDSFSALDFKTDSQLRQALREEAADTTKIIVAQRVGTINDVDQIIVLDEGCIVGKGTHDDLMAKSDVYQEIAYSQLSKEELA